MSNQVDLERTTEDERLIEKAKIVAFCLNNGYSFDADDDDEVLIYVPQFKRISDE